MCSPSRPEGQSWQAIQHHLLLSEGEAFPARCLSPAMGRSLRSPRGSLERPGSRRSATCSPEAWRRRTSVGLPRRQVCARGRPRTQTSRRCPRSVLRQPPRLCTHSRAPTSSELRGLRDRPGCHRSRAVPARRHRGSWPMRRYTMGVMALGGGERRGSDDGPIQVCPSGHVRRRSQRVCSRGLSFHCHLAQPGEGTHYLADHCRILLVQAVGGGGAKEGACDREERYW